ncbi:phosphoinositide 3-kinase adapter protein 1-like isoform X2 [Liolophura sinensis]|uniref:phosphoinositide 3-kinase adapter protein 1-like isoform X2 n=1 Tax=Liolophura sinensis TaxID=3198878 RepID=UPI003158CCFB
MAGTERTSSTMVHVCLFFSSDGVEWAEFLANILRQKQLDLQVATFDVNAQDTGTVHQKALLKVLLVTPEFLHHFNPPEPAWLPNPSDSTSNVMVLLCAVEASRLSRYTRYSDWKILTVENSDFAVKKLIKSIAKTVDECEQRSPMPIKPKPPLPAPRRRISQTQPCHPDPTTSGNIPIPVRSKIPIQRVLPEKHVPGEKLTVIFNDPPGGEEKIEMDINGQRITPKVLNPYTYELKLPDGLFGKVQMYIYQGSERLNSYQLSFEPPDLTVFTYKGMLTQTLRIPNDDNEALDQKLVETLNTSLPAGNLETLFPGSLADTHKSDKSDKHQPTVLHFAAYNGLRELCCRLLEIPGALLAYQTENCDGHDPAELADEAGHTELADYLRNYVETQVTVKMVDNIYEAMNGHSLVYANTRPRESSMATGPADIYSYLPMDRQPQYPVEFEEETDDIDEKLYMKGHATELVPERFPPKSLPRSNSEKFKQKPPSFKANPLPKSSTIPRGFCFGNEKPSPGTVGSRSQEELKMIQIMVAEGKFSMEDSQKLFDAWKLRYDTPSSSFKERQKALNDLRTTFRTTLETAEYSKGKSYWGNVLNRVQLSRKKKSNTVENTADQDPVRYVPCISISSPLYEQVDEELRHDIYSQAFQDRSSNGSAYSSASGGSRGSRTSTGSSGVGSFIEEESTYSMADFSRGRQQKSRREKVVQDTSSLMMHPAPSIPRADRPKLRRPMPPPPPRH